MGDEPVTQHLSDFFEISLATTEELRNDVYQVRYDVYCTEFGYEPPNDEEREKDRFDELSLHCIVRHISSGKPAGCVRLVETPADNPDASLPFESVCSESLNLTLLRSRDLNRSSFCEISRLAVHPAFRKRSGERESRLGYLGEEDLSDVELRLFPIITIALFLAATSLVVQTGRNNVFAMMEPRLARLLQRSGLNFTCVSDNVDFHGPRAAFHISIEDALNGMNLGLRELYDIVNDAIVADMRGFVKQGFTRKL